MRTPLGPRLAFLLTGMLLTSCDTPPYALREPLPGATEPTSRRQPESTSSAVSGSPEVAAKADARTAKLHEALQTHSFERVVCPEDIEDATVKFTHFADEKDAVEDDYYEITGRGVVLGIQDSQYVIFTTRCALDFTWPNHEIRWRDVHGFEDGPPELRNEGIILHGTSVRSAGDEYFFYGGSNLLPAAPPNQHNSASLLRDRRRAVLAQAREFGDVVTIDRFSDGKGAMSDVALLYVPIHRQSTIQLRHLGLTTPKDSVRELLSKHDQLYGMHFEFSCPECQNVVAGYRSREVQAFALGFGIGLVTGAVAQAMIQRLLDVDTAVASVGNAGTARIDPMRRIADAGLRRQILERDGFVCTYAKFGMCDPATCWACIAKNLHVDHILAFSRGGKTVPSNLVAACAACNMSKGYELLSQWMAEAGR